MRKLLSISLIVLLFGSSVLYYTGCGGEKQKPKGNTVIGNSNISYISAPTGGKQVVEGEAVEITLSLNNIPEDLDSVCILVDGKTVFTSAEKKEKYSFSFKDSVPHMGTYSIETRLKQKNGAGEIQTSHFVVKSKDKPKDYIYSIKNTYTHDISAYTQGLAFDNGTLYEGTGLNGKSELRIVDFRSGKVLKQHKLEDTYFGEGITILGDKIYQLTYRSEKGFVYNKKTFELEKEFTYTTEGWGLTHNGTHLIYSDGSNKLYFLNPENFEKVKTLEVYDDYGPMMMLNELEYINGEVWANVYQTDKIVRINPANGKVTGIIDMAYLLKPEEYIYGETDVLNGIAYDDKARKIYVTGKKWPWLWEVEIMEGKLAESH